MQTSRLPLALSCAALVLCAAAPAFAQQPGAGAGWQGGFSTNGGATGTGFGAPATGGYGRSAPAQASSDFEIGSLYVASAAYGALAGVWIDAEANITDPGLRFVAPAVLGVGGPVGVYFLDQPKLPRGVPAAISTGIALGAGEGIGIFTYQFVTSESEKSWGFKEFSRATFIGATVGGAAGAAVGFLQEPSPKTSLLLGSSSVWGAAIGSMFGYGGTSTGIGYGLANDGASLGGLIGYNAGILAAAGISTVWVPTYRSLAYMWMGAGAGFVVTLPVYLFYAGASDDHPAKRGLIVQGVGTTLGLAAGAIFTFNDRDDMASNEPPRRSFAQVTGVGMMPVPGGAGAQLTGVLF